MTLYFGQQPYRGDFHHTGMARRRIARHKQRAAALLRQRRHALGFGASLDMWIFEKTSGLAYGCFWHAVHCEWKSYTTGKHYRRWKKRPNPARARVNTQACPF